MAKPRVFISSTYYDLKHIRASLELFIQSLGFEAILSEKGDIAYSPEIPLDESCYREAAAADVYVLVIGGRYGSEISETQKSSKKAKKSFYERYESITKREYASANNNKVPIYILIEKSVYAEYQTYRQNKSNDSVAYAHVDSVNIFNFVDEILSQPFNNPVQTFEKFSDIDNWLRDQWAGLFRDLLNRRSEQSQLSTLSNEVKQLGELNTTLKRYMETLLKASKQPGSEQVIQQEDRRLDEARQRAEVKNTTLVKYLSVVSARSEDDVADLFLKTSTFENLVNAALDQDPGNLKSHLLNSPSLRMTYDEARKVVSAMENTPAKAGKK